MKFFEKSLIIFLTIISLNFSWINGQTTQNQTITTTEPASESSLPTWVGFIGCLIASIFFGSNFLPVKRFNAGDGLFFQFASAVAIWVVGMILDLALGNKRFYPLVMVGGFIWTTGNLVCVFCIKTVGLSVGLLIWGTTSLVMGWAGGRFGILGVTPQIPSTTTKLVLNYLGVIFAAISGIFFLFIKSTNTPRKADSSQIQFGAEPLDLNRLELEEKTENKGDPDFPFLDRMSAPVQKAVGCTIAAIAGIFFGVMFIPDQYIRDHKVEYELHGEFPPNNGLYYIHSQYSGILISAFGYFVIYTFFKRNKPNISPEIALPAMISGAMWAIANIGFIVAISSLGGSVAYPIVNVLPGIVSSLWSLFMFREIQGMKNFIFLGVGMFVRILAAVLSGLSG